jgi:hypothetical protein
MGDYLAIFASFCQRRMGGILSINGVRGLQRKQVQRCRYSEHTFIRDSMPSTKPRMRFRILAICKHGAAHSPLADVNSTQAYRLQPRACLSNICGSAILVVVQASPPSPATDGLL